MIGLMEFLAMPVDVQAPIHGKKGSHAWICKLRSLSDERREKKRSRFDPDSRAHLMAALLPEALLRL